MFLLPLGCRVTSTLNSLVKAITYFTLGVPNYVVWVVRYEIATGYDFVDLHEAGGLFLRLYHSLIRSAVGVIPTRNPRAVNNVVLSRSIPFVIWTVESVCSSFGPNTSCTLTDMFCALWIAVELAPQVYVPLWLSFACSSSSDMICSLTVLLKILLPRAFCKGIVSSSRPLKSQNVHMSSASVNFTLHSRVIVLPTSNVMFCCVVVTFSTSRRRRKINHTRHRSQQVLGEKRGLCW